MLTQSQSAPDWGQNNQKKRCENVVKKWENANFRLRERITADLQIEFKSSFLDRRFPSLPPTQRE